MVHYGFMVGDGGYRQHPQGLEKAEATYRGWPRSGGVTENEHRRGFTVRASPRVGSRGPIASGRKFESRSQ